VAPVTLLSRLNTLYCQAVRLRREDVIKEYDAATSAKDCVCCPCLARHRQPQVSLTFTRHARCVRGYECTRIIVLPVASLFKRNRSAPSLLDVHCRFRDPTPGRLPLRPPCIVFAYKRRGCRLI
jgi:hypothetical protein